MFFMKIFQIFSKQKKNFRNKNFQNINKRLLETTITNQAIFYYRFSLCEHSLRKKFPYSEFFWSVFSRSQTEYGNFQNKSLYSVQLRDNTDQKSSEYRHFLRSDRYEVG